MRERGSVLVVCMVLAALGTIGVAAWFSLLDARSQQVEVSLRALERRVAVGNGRALAHQVVYGRYLHGNETPTGDVVYELPDGKGRAVVRAFSTVPLRSDTTGAVARDGATPLVSNSTDVRVEVSNGTGTNTWTYRLRNCHPVAAGNLLTIHPPVNPTDSADLVSGRLHVKGRAVFWDATANDLKNGIRAEEFALPGSTAGKTTFSTPANDATLPLNYPNYLRTTGVTASGPAYRGELEFLSATVNPQNSYEARMQAAAPLQLNGTMAKSEGSGVSTIPSQSGDATLLTFITNNPPAIVAEELAKQSSLSSTVLIAAVQKSNPALSDAQVLQVFDAQSLVPDDALTEMMAGIDEASLTPALDAAVTAFNVKTGTQYNNNGAGKVQFHLNRPEISRVIATNVKHLRLFGQADAATAASAASLPPLVIVIDNRGGESMTRIDLVHENQRPLIVVAASPATSPALPLTVFSGNAAFPSFRVVFDLQNTGLAFDLDNVAGAKILGGIRGNHRVTVQKGTLTLERDPGISVLLPHLSRDAWVETVRN
jgi:hypothetical protein